MVYLPVEMLTGDYVTGAISPATACSAKAYRWLWI